MDNNTMNSNSYGVGILCPVCVFTCIDSLFDRLGALAQKALCWVRQQLCSTDTAPALGTGRADSCKP